MCTLRASGRDFSVDDFLKGSSMIPDSVYYRGQPRRPAGSVSSASGANFGVSDSPWSDLPAQVRDAEAFLVQNREELRRLSEWPNLEDLVLDFPVELRADGQQIVAQSDRLPASLIQLASEFGIAIEITTYS